MENAIDEVKKIAFKRVPSNDEDGIAVGLEMFCNIWSILTYPLPLSLIANKERGSFCLFSAVVLFVFTYL